MLVLCWCPPSFFWYNNLAFKIDAALRLRGIENVGQVLSDLEKKFQNKSFEFNVKVGGTRAATIDKLAKSFDTFGKSIRSAGADADAAAQQFTKLFASISGQTATLGNFAKASQDSIKQIRLQEKAAKDAATSIDDLGVQAQLAVKRFVAFSITAGILIKLSQTLKESVSNALDFQKSIVQLEQVTGGLGTEVNKITQEVLRLSTSLGVSSKELIGVARTLKQAGLSAKDTQIALEALAKTALAPSFGDLSNTTEAVIAAMNQFRIPAEKVEGVLSAINEVSAQYAIEAEDITVGITKAGGAFAAAGGNFNEFLAILTSVRQTTRESADTCL